MEKIGWSKRGGNGHGGEGKFSDAVISLKRMGAKRYSQKLKYESATYAKKFAANGKKGRGSALTVGLAVPVELSGRILVFGQNFQFQYALPQNATLFENFFRYRTSSRRNVRSVRENHRAIVYELLQRDFHRRGADGRECLKRSICEAAVTPLLDEGLVGELLHLLLT